MPAPHDPEPPPKPAGSSFAAGYPKAGWSKLVREDSVPLCVFSDALQRAAAPFLDQVKPQKLAAGASVVFGAYAPSCVNPDCDDLPSLQCWIERDGKTLVVHSKYISYHKDASSCSDGCKSVIAGCQTPVLAAGSYKVRYGAREFTLKLPSKLGSPCYPTQ